MQLTPTQVRVCPPVKQFPPPIDAMPGEIAEVVLRAKPKKEWDYLKRRSVATGI